MSTTAVRRLIEGGAMPLAQLAQRARNSKSAEAVFQNARCLGEATAALGAAFWLGKARQAGPTLPPRLREALANLVRRGSAFGTWVGLLRESATAVGGDALSRLLRPLDDLEPIEQLAAALEPLLAPDGPFGSDADGLRKSLRRARGEGVLGFLDFLVVLRNRVHGHGAVTPEAVCRTLGGPLLEAVSHVASQEVLLDGHWLARTAVSVLGEQKGQHWKRLTGIGAEFLDGGDPELPSATDADPRFLHFIRGREMVSASFLVAQEEDSTGLSRFGFFQRLGRGRATNVEFIDYLGAPFRSDTVVSAAEESVAGVIDDEPGQPRQAGSVEPSEPCSHAPSAGQDGVRGGVPWWKTGLFFLIAALPQFLLWFGAIRTPNGILSAIGLPPPYTVGAAVAATAVFSAGLVLAAVLVARFWRRGIRNRWLQGPGFIVFPALGLGLILFHYLQLQGQVDSYLTSVASFSTLGEAQATRASGLIEHSLARFLNAVAVDASLVWILATTVLLGFLLLKPRGERPRSARRWLAVPVGLAIGVVCELFVLSEHLAFVRFAMHAMWLVTAIGLLRVREPERDGYSPGWRTLGAGIIATLALSVVNRATGYILAIRDLEGGDLVDLPPGGRVQLFQRVVNPFMQQGVLYEWALFAVLFGIVAVACRRVLPVPTRFGTGARRSAPLLAIAVVTVLPVAVLFGAMAGTGREWLPLEIVGMHPATLRPGAAPSFYIDDRPENLARARRALFAGLSGREVFSTFREPVPLPSDDQLLGVLAGGRSCHDALAAALKIGEPGTSARCVTAVEAKLYCEGLGKRLPSPEEWEATLGAANPSGGPGGGPVRADLAEWTMRMVHGTPTFEVHGRGGGEGDATRMAPDEFSPAVGFRCALTPEL